MRTFSLLALCVACGGGSSRPVANPDEQDVDGDGVLDRMDACPDLRETANGFDDDDGCPDQKPVRTASECFTMVPKLYLRRARRT